MRPKRPNTNPGAARADRMKTHVRQETGSERKERKREEAQGRCGASKKGHVRTAAGVCRKCAFPVSPNIVLGEG